MKAEVTLAGVPLAANQAIAWQLVSGTTPYTTTFSVHRSQWDSNLSGRRGHPSLLKIVDARGKETRIEQVYILHEVPSDSPNRASFVVADRRWRWQYKLIVRDYNMPRKTGSRTAQFDSVPVETRQAFDEYDYLRYSLDGDKRWSARRAVEDVLDQLEGTGNYRVDGFPIRTGLASGDAEHTLQGVVLREQGDVALSRLLSYVPGADVYVNPRGQVVVFDAADLDSVDAYFSALPPTTWDGERAARVNRIAVRPKKVIAHYQREVEVLFEFKDDYGPTSAPPDRDAPYCDNVIPTVDPMTSITEYDPLSGKDVTTDVPPGTWVRVDRWLEAMDDDRPEDSLPWTFDTIAAFWLRGDMEAALGSKGADQSAAANIAARVDALRRHFRQTFRINPRYMQRVRSLRAARVALLHPITGARSPAAVWGQACRLPNTKGKIMADRHSGGTYHVTTNLDYLVESKAGARIIDTPPGPTAVEIVDEDLGIFALRWLASPYGYVDSYVPCNIVDDGGSLTAVTRDLSKQDEKPVGVAMHVEGATYGTFLRKTMEFKAILTIVPAAPNSKLQLHRQVVEAGDIAKVFQHQFRIEGGRGPDLEVFVSPGEATARFAWKDDTEARQTLKALLGMLKDDEGTPDVDESAGLEGPELPGYVWVNEERHLTNHAISLGAELLANFADGLQGIVTTIVPQGDLRLAGNMKGLTVRVGAAPSAKVDVVHQFPGRQRQLSRFAFLPESARHILLGVVPFK